MIVSKLVLLMLIAALLIVAGLNLAMYGRTTETVMIIVVPVERPVEPVEILPRDLGRTADALIYNAQGVPDVAIHRRPHLRHPVDRTF